MRYLILLAALATLSGCGAVRDTFGGVGDWFGSGKPRVAGPAAAIDTNPGVPASDIDEARRKVPGGLIADTENVRHTGETIPPQ